MKTGWVRTRTRRQHRRYRRGQGASPTGKPIIFQQPYAGDRYLTHAEAQRLLQAAESPVNAEGMALTSQYKSPVLRDFIELALNTGCRKGELLNLKWENIDFSTRSSPSGADQEWGMADRSH